MATPGICTLNNPCNRAPLSHRRRYWLPRLGRPQERLQALQPAVNVRYLSAAVRIVVASGRHALCHPCSCRCARLLRRHSGNEAATCAAAHPAIPAARLLVGVLLQPLPHLQQRPAGGCRPLVAGREAGARRGGGPDCRSQPLCAPHCRRPLPRVTQRPAPLGAAVAGRLLRPVRTGVSAGHAAALRRRVPCSAMVGAGSGGQSTASDSPVAGCNSWHNIQRSNNTGVPPPHWPSASREPGRECGREPGREGGREPPGDCRRAARRTSSKRRAASRSRSRLIRTYSVGSNRPAEVGREVGREEGREPGRETSADRERGGPPERGRGRGGLISAVAE